MARDDVMWDNATRGEKVKVNSQETSVCRARQAFPARPQIL